MKLPRPSLTVRLRAASALLLGRGDAATVCSFCGQGSAAGARIVAGPGVAICGACARMALAYADGTVSPVSPEGARIVSLFVLDAPACRLPGHRGTLAADLDDTAAACGVTLVAWQYRCALGQGGDEILAHIAVPGGTDDADLAARFLTRFHRTAMGSDA